MLFSTELYSEHFVLKRNWYATQVDILLLCIDGIKFAICGDQKFSQRTFYK